MATDVTASDPNSARASAPAPIWVEVGSRTAAKGRTPADARAFPGRERRRTVPARPEPVRAAAVERQRAPPKSGRAPCRARPIRDAAGLALDDPCVEQRLGSRR